ncbi:MAG: AMP-binding protein, partial [Gammaproteobacteria bacterium]|nr:AMP-binding protein [Gammaproteobacteria bacterium]
GVPPFAIQEICVNRHLRDKADQPALIGDETLTWAELAQRIRTSQVASGGGPVSMSGDLSVDSVVAVLAALFRGQRLNLQEGASAPQLEGAGDIEEVEVPDLLAPILSIQGIGGLVSHSHKSLLANVVSVVTFLGPDPERSWFVSRPLHTWEGLLSLLMPLYLGVPVILGRDDNPEEFAETIVQHRPGYAMTNLDLAAITTREAKRPVKKAREILDAMLLKTDGVFDPGDRQRIGKSYRCHALTVFGMAETGVILAAHPQWYLDESVGIPITNAHVVPADPRNGSAIQTLWELVESAEVTVKGPALMTGYEDRNDTDYLVDGRFRTKVIASSDANGMIYILPD